MLVSHDSRGSLAVEQEIQLRDLSYEEILNIALQLKHSTARGITITGELYPVKATYIITPDGNEGLSKTSTSL